MRTTIQIAKQHWALLLTLCIVAGIATGLAVYVVSTLIGCTA